jgi:hypothetical protein
MDPFGAASPGPCASGVGAADGADEDDSAGGAALPQPAVSTPITDNDATSTRMVDTVADLQARRGHFE